MKFFKKAKKEGVSLRITFIAMLIVSITITVILLVTTFDTIQSFRSLSRATARYINLQEAASSLMDASDYLTDEAQCFTVMGKREHMENYLREAFETKRREKAVAVIEEQLPESEPLQEIKNAMRESLSLMDREYYAMRLVLASQESLDIPEALQGVVLTPEDQVLSSEEKKKLAEEMLHDSIYYDQKNMIRMHLKQCIQEIQEGTYGMQHLTEVKLRTDLIWITVMIALQSVMVILILLLSTKLGIKPILRAVEHIKQDQQLPVIGSREFRYLAGTYNVMYSAYKKSIENLSYEASHDKLTGLYNRAGYELYVEGVHPETTAFLLFDADGFKTVNDTRGHEAGDCVLKKIGETLTAHFRSDDFVCRFGGDEFVVIMSHVSKDTRPIIEEKIEKINTDLQDLGPDLPSVSVSAGVVLCSEAEDITHVFHQADLALYQVKNNGRKGCCFYDEKMKRG